MSDPKLETLLLEVHQDGVAVITFNRPEVRNCLNIQMVEEIRRVLGQLEASHDVKVVVLTGAGGKSFISGADISELRDRKRDAAFKLINTGLFRELEKFPKPTIAAIRGYALGGGLELAMACDLRVCGESAKVGQPEVSLGIIPGAGGTYRLQKLVGLGRAKELVLTGRIIGAEEAFRIGLVNQVAPDDETVEAAKEMARTIAGHSALAVRLAKQGLNNASEMSVDAAIAYESTAQAVLFDDEEKIRRMTAFLERKKK